MANKGLLRLITTFETPRVGELREFEEWMHSWGAADRTVRERCTVITAALREWGAGPEYVTTALLTTWLASPRFSPWTRVTYYHHLRSYFGWLTESGQIGTNPTDGLKAPRQPKDKPRPLSDDEARRALETASGHLRAWLLLGMLAGLRAHEIAKLRGVDVTERTIYVVGKGSSAAYLPTHPTIWALADDYPRSGWWFPSRAGSKSPHVSGMSISTLVTRHFSALGIEGSSHRCRHSYATNLLRNGVNIRVVQELMRHTSLSTTAKYTAVTESEQTAAIRGLVA